MSTARNFRPIATTLNYYEGHLHMKAYPREGAGLHTLAMALDGSHLDWQVVSPARFFHAIGTVFSSTERLILQYDRQLIP
jgi:hypothetical protein